MSAPYANLNGTAAGQDVMYLFQYGNDITGNLFGPFMVLGFFLIVLIGSLIMQQRFTNRMVFPLSLTAASFSTLGFALILEQRSGIFGPGLFIALIILTILSVLWLTLQTD